MSITPQTIERPELTFPEEVGAWVCELYGAANVIFEYGSGGSTVMASEMTGKRIFSVESDKRWFKPAEIRGRMARFDITPMDLPRRDLTEILTLYTKPF